eukprot:CCRYP_004767-RA/>CCRYP_004767-RA protein AED:0.25 eAED:0.28 QI:0/0/0/1/1/1/3/0/487
MWTLTQAPGPDNEASAAYKQAILASGMTYQLVPPDDHRRNVAEKAIQTWNDNSTSYTYAQHCSRGWIIGTSVEHYRCWKVWAPTTHSTRISATVFFKHKYLTNPSVSPTDALIAAAANLAHVIKHNAKAQHVGAKNLQDLQRLQQLFSDAAKQPPLPPTPTTPISAHAPPPRVQPHTQIPTAWPRPSTSPVISDDEDSDDEMAPPPRVPTRRPIPVLPRPQPTMPPALNTRSRTRSLTHKTMLHFLATRHIGITAAQATQRRYPPDMLHAVLNDDTGDCGTPTADMITVKILLNSVISTVNARFMTIDIKDFYLNTPMAHPEYMRLKLADIPAAIIDLYHLRDIARDGFVFVRIQKGMYGLPQAGIIAQQLLEQRLQANGYHLSKINPGFWTHDWQPLCFALCVDDFGVKYVGKEHAVHLINTLKGHYDISTDWEGCRYIRLTLRWDYRKHTVRLSMPGYCEKLGSGSITLSLPNGNINLIPVRHDG